MYKVKAYQPAVFPELSKKPRNRVFLNTFLSILGEIERIQIETKVTMLFIGVVSYCNVLKPGLCPG
jgi:hypothetical protein